MTEDKQPLIDDIKVDMKMVKGYLNQLRYIDNQIDSRQKELEDIKDKGFLKATVASKNKVQESTVDMYDEKYMKIWELPETIINEIDEYVDTKQKIRKQIHSLDDQLEVLILRERHLNQSKWENIAVNQRQTIRNIQLIHGRALQNFCEKYEEEVLKYTKDKFTS